MPGMERACSPHTTPLGHEPNMPPLTDWALLLLGEQGPSPPGNPCTIRLRCGRAGGHGWAELGFCP